MRHMVSYVGFALVVLLAWVRVQAASDPQLQQAQQKLAALGYYSGAIDGTYGQRTREALTAYQRAQKLTVSGTLDGATLQALGLVPAPEEDTKPPNPTYILLRPVLDYMRFYETQPARVLPHVTEHFRNGTTPQAWVEYTLDMLAKRGYARISWRIQHVVLDDARAVVQVRSRIRVDGQEVTQSETFTLVRTADEDWLIDDWHGEIIR